MLGAEDRPFPLYTPNGQLYSQSWRPIRPELRSIKILAVGLQKTGSTSAGWALADAGIRVSHNQGDDFSDTCQAAFSASYPYWALRRRHPDAAWLVMYASNFTAWAHSLRHFHHNQTKLLRPGLAYMPCHMYQCDQALTPEMQVCSTPRGSNLGCYVYTVAVWL